MKTTLIILFVVLNIIAAINCHSLDENVLNRAKRSDDEGFFSKVKTGLKNFGTKTKNFFVNGYEETKNLFSSDRKVGDYTLDEIDVRFDAEDDENSTTSTEAPRKKRETPKIIEESKVSEDEFDDDVVEEFVYKQENDEDEASRINKHIELDVQN